MSWKRFSSAFAIIIAVTTTANVSMAQEHNHAEHQHGKHKHSAMGKGPNGGMIQTVGSHRIETVIMPKGIMFVALDANGKAIAAPNASGALKLRIDDGTQQYPYELKPLKNNAIGVAVDLSKVVGHTLHMDVTLNGLAAQPVSFHAMGKVSDGKLSDAVLISLQATCPVSGKKLGSMGAPPKVVVDGKPLFVCCAGCAKKLHAQPDEFLAKLDRMGVKPPAIK